MTSDSDDALSWDGDDVDAAPVRPLPRGWKAVGKGSDGVATETDPDAGGEAPRLAAPIASAPEPDEELAAEDEDDVEQPGLGTGMLLALGVFGGVYLLYTVGWVIGGLRLKPLANLIVADAMYLPWFFLAVAAPALWFLAGWVLTRRRASWIRILVLLLGVVLLVPWPFVTVGVVG